MSLKLNSAMALLLLSLAPTTALADMNLYAGGGLSFNRVDSPFHKAEALTAAGLTAFLGYRFEKFNGELQPRIEFGYGKTQEFIKNTKEDYSIQSIWVSGAIRKYMPEINPNLYAQARLGLDFGDDDGLFQGLSMGYYITPELAAQYEYQNKDASTSHQLTFSFDF